MAQIQWFPGHMAKAKREIADKIKLIDIVVELVDARAPYSSKNPLFNSVVNNKPRLIVMTKEDLADDKLTQKWLDFYKSKGYYAMSVNLKQFNEYKKIIQVCKEILKDKMAREAKKGLKPRAMRAMVLGIPNVGKSTFINRLAKRKATVTGNKPGVTKAQQIIKVDKDFELFDTPGVLWPKFEDQQVGLRLALIGSIRDEILNQDEMAIELIEYLKNHYQGILADRYQVDENEDKVKILEQIALNRNCKMKGNELDYEKASKIVLEEFRNGKLGKISLETPEEGTKEA